MTVSEKLSLIAQNEQKVYEKAKNSQNDMFWKAITNNGTRTDYNSAFIKGNWNKNNFLPTYNIVPKHANQMFYQLEPGSEELQIDMEELERKQGIKFDFSQCVSFDRIFAGGLFSSINVLDMSSSTGNPSYVFYGAYTSRRLRRINRLIFSQNTTPHSTWFGYSDITHIGFEGVLAKNGLNVAPCALDKESITKLIGILSPDTSGLTVTLSKKAINNAFGIDIDDETTYPEGSEYYILRNTKQNWTFNYA